jgi:hypothetical protein
VAASAWCRTRTGSPLLSVAPARAGAGDRVTAIATAATPATTTTAAAAATPVRTRPASSRRPRLRASWVLLSGGVMPSSSPVAGSPSRSTTDCVIRSGRCRGLPSRKVPRRELSV